MTDRAVELLTEGLVHAAGMAYVEDAPGTAKMIQSIDKLVRYLFRKPVLSSVQDELGALESYAVLQMSRFQNGITVRPYPKGDIFVTSGDIIGFVDECYLIEMQKGGEYELIVSLGMTMDVNKGCVLTLSVNAVRQKRSFAYEMKLSI